MPPPGSSFGGVRFLREVIVLAVRWYPRYGLSYRDVEERLAERGIDVDHVTVYRWVRRFIPLLIDAARPCRHAPGDRWFIDETYVRLPAVALRVPIRPRERIQPATSHNTTVPAMVATADNKADDPDKP